MDRLVGLTCQKLRVDQRKDSVVERRYIQKRPISMPTRMSQNWLPRERPYESGEKPLRSISLASKYQKSRDPRRPARQQYSAHYIVDRKSHMYYDSNDYSDDTDDETSYDSDEGDRRNGVPVTVTGNAGRELTEDIENEVNSKMQQVYRLRSETKKDLEHQHRKCAPLHEQYATAREAVVEWPDDRWLRFLELEDDISHAKGDLAFLDLQIQNLYAQILSFANHNRIRSHGGHWSRQGGAMVWSMLGAAEELAEGRGHLPLTYKGFDYDSHRLSLTDANLPPPK